MRKFKPISDNDTRELRILLKLPITKKLRYMEHVKDYEKQYVPHTVVDYTIARQYQPSGAYSLNVTLENGKVVRISALFFAHMQRPSFADDMKNLRVDKEELGENEPESFRYSFGSLYNDYDFFIR